MWWSGVVRWDGAKEAEWASGRATLQARLPRYTFAEADRLFWSVRQIRPGPVNHFAYLFVAEGPSRSGVWKRPLAVSCRL